MVRKEFIFPYSLCLCSDVEQLFQHQNIPCLSFLFHSLAKCDNERLTEILADVISSNVVY